MLIFLRRTLSTHTTFYNDPDYEIVHITLTLRHTPLHIFATYIPFSSSHPIHSASEHFQHLRESISAVRSTARILILGDLNSRIPSSFHNKDIYHDNTDERNETWPDSHLLSTIPPRTSTETIKQPNTNARQLLKLCQQLDLIILNGRGTNSSAQTRPPGYRTHNTTKKRKRFQGSVLDYAISSPSLYSQGHFQVHERLDTISDHCQISLVLRLPHTIQRTVTPQRLNHRAVHWTTIQRQTYHQHMHEVWQHFTPGNSLLTSLEQTLQQSVQHLLQQPRNNRRPSPPWMSDNTVALNRRYRQALNQHRRWQSHTTRQQLQAAHRDYRRALRRDKRRLELHQSHELLYLCKHHSSKLWELIKPKALPAATLLEPSRLAEYIGELYQAPEPDSSTEQTPELVVPPDEVLCRPFDDAELSLTTHFSIHNGVACGPDRIPNEVLRYNSNELYEWLSNLFNRHFFASTYPEEWKVSQVHALHKKGDATDPNNYRLLNINSTIGKLYSVCLNQRLAEFTEDQLSDLQFGFRARRSTDMATLVLLSYIRHARATQKPMYLVFVDFKKAFDTVNRAKLFRRLLEMGISTQFVEALRALYTDLVAKVRNHPDLIPLERGVKQGDPLSPLLFALYINSLEKYLRDLGFTGYEASTVALLILLYADDTVLVANSYDEAVKMFNAVHAFCSDLDLTINIEKTEAMIINDTQPATTFINTTLGPIAVVEEFKYLGTTIHHSGSLSTHMKQRELGGQRARFQWENFRREHPAMTPHTLFNVFESLCTSTSTHGIHLERLQQARPQVKSFNKIRDTIMCHLLGLPATCSRKILYGTFTTWSMDWHLLNNQCLLYIRCRNMPSTSIVRHALELDFSLPKQWSWTKQLLDALDRYPGVDLNTQQPEQLTNILQQHWWNQWWTEILAQSSATIWHRAFQLNLQFQHHFSMEPDWIITTPKLDIHTRRQLLRIKAQAVSLPLFRYLAHQQRDQRLKDYIRNYCPGCHRRISESVFHLTVECPRYNLARETLITAIRNPDLKHMFQAQDPDCLAALLAAPLEMAALRQLVKLVDQRISAKKVNDYNVLLARITRTLTNL